MKTRMTNYSLNASRFPLIPRVLYEFRVRSQLNLRDRHQYAIRLRLTRRALEEPGSIVLTEANEILAALRFGGELKKTLIENRGPDLSLAKRRCQRLGRREDALANDIDQRYRRACLTELVQRFGLDQINLGQTEHRVVVAVFPIQVIRIDRPLQNANAVALARLRIVRDIRIEVKEVSRAVLCRQAG